MKATKTEIETRLKTVYSMITSGLNNTDICQNMSKIYNISHRQVYRLIDKAIIRIKENNIPEYEKQRSIANERYNNLYWESLKKKKYRDCVYIQSRIDKINGLENNIININTNANKKDPYQEFFEAFGEIK